VAKDNNNYRALENIVIEHLGSIECGKFLDYLWNCTLLKSSAP